jgi:hypothetical protein
VVLNGLEVALEVLAVAIYFNCTRVRVFFETSFSPRNFRRLLALVQCVTTAMGKTM